MRWVHHLLHPPLIHADQSNQSQIFGLIINLQCHPFSSLLCLQREGFICDHIMVDSDYVSQDAVNRVAVNQLCIPEKIQLPQPWYPVFNTSLLAYMLLVCICPFPLLTTIELKGTKSPSTSLLDCRIPS